MNLERTWKDVIVLYKPIRPPTPLGNQYIFTATDYFTKWVEAFPMKSKTAREVATCMATIFWHHGASVSILTDQGTEFVNQVRQIFLSFYLF